MKFPESEHALLRPSWQSALSLALPKMYQGRAFGCVATRISIVQFIGAQVPKPMTLEALTQFSPRVSCRDLATQLARRYRLLRDCTPREDHSGAGGFSLNLLGA